jgi:hypothetical protein
MKAKFSIIRSTLFIILTGLLMVSCDKDEDPEDELVGTWTSETSTFSAMVNDVTMAQYFTDVLGLTASDAQIYANLFSATLQQNFTGTITFMADKTYTSSFGGRTESGTWNMSADGQTLTIDPTSDEPSELEIVKLTSDELELHWTEITSEDLDEDDIDETITIDITLRFSR